MDKAFPNNAMLHVKQDAEKLIQNVKSKKDRIAYFQNKTFDVKRGIWMRLTLFVFYFW